MKRPKKKFGSENYASIKKPEVNLIPIKVISELVSLDSEPISKNFFLIGTQDYKMPYNPKLKSIKDIPKVFRNKTKKNHRF